MDECDFLEFRIEDNNVILGEGIDECSKLVKQWENNTFRIELDKFVIIKNNILTLIDT